MSHQQYTGYISNIYFLKAGATQQGDNDLLLRLSMVLGFLNASTIDSKDKTQCLYSNEAIGFLQEPR